MEIVFRNDPIFNAILSVFERNRHKLVCPVCGKKLSIRGYVIRKIITLDGILYIPVSKVGCTNHACSQVNSVDYVVPEFVIGHCAFHVVKDCYDRFDWVRISVMNQLRSKDAKSDEYYLIKHFNWMLKRDDERFYDPSLPKKFNRRMNRYLNLFDIYQLLLDIHRLLTEGVNLRDELKSFFENTTSKNAKEEFSKLVKCFSESDEPEFKKFASTLIKWKWSIINYFINLGDNINVKHISNGLLENRNKIIKEIKYNANGYRNFERFRARIFYSLNKNDDHYLINPDKEKQEYNKQRLKNNYQRYLKKIENKKPN